MLHRLPSAAGLRRRRYRQRQAAGRAVYLVELSTIEIDWLIRLRWLSETEVSDREAVGRAIAAMVAASARR